MIRRFAKCTLCKELNDVMTDALRQGSITKGIKARLTRHAEWFTRERREYYKKRENAILKPSAFCSIIVDGAGQIVPVFLIFLFQQNKSTVTPWRFDWSGVSNMLKRTTFTCLSWMRIMLLEQITLWNMCTGFCSSGQLNLPFLRSSSYKWTTVQERTRIGTFLVTWKH